MHEVVRDIASLEHRCNRGTVGRIRGLPSDALPGSLLATRDGDNIVLACQLAEQRSTDRSRSAEDDDLHRRASRINRAK